MCAETGKEERKRDESSGIGRDGVDRVDFAMYRVRFQFVSVPIAAGLFIYIYILAFCRTDSAGYFEF